MTSIVGCTNEKMLWAPRIADADRAPKTVEQIKVVEVGKPDCDYRVIGSAFGQSLDVLKDVAAAHGGDGIYDQGCSLKTVGGVMGDIDLRHTDEDCAGRVYVCQ